MSPEERETQERGVGHWFAQLEREISPLADDDLRALARTATSRPRPLPRPPARVRRWPLQARWTGILVFALVVAIGLGAGLGALLAPSSTAAPGPVGTGFLPEPGWTVLQTGADATLERQALAVATNVPLHPEDSARGIRNSSGLPYSTLLQLPPRGVVIVALFTLRLEYEPWADELFPVRELPVRVRDAMSSISYSYQMRPERPLGQYELRATVGDHRVLLHFYFGARNPSLQLIATAQRQLDRLIVASVSGGQADLIRRPTASSTPLASKIIDRTIACELGLRQFEAQASAPIRSLKSVGSVGATTNRGYGLLGRVSEHGLSLDAKCSEAAVSVPLSSRGLAGGVVRFSDERYDCVTSGKVLIRARGVFRSPTRLKRERIFDFPYLSAHGAIHEGQFAIRSRSGKPLVYGDFVAAKRTRLFAADSCVRDHLR